MKRMLLALAAALLPGVVAAAQSTAVSGKDVAPGFEAPADEWVNWDADLSLEKLRGHVVWVEFSFIH